ncbi:MAG: deoxyribonuclease V [Chloroflexi bacterium]|jgi:deoxyribonuclease V|nr:deoxyribonuclease V [Chloroflexota bacterium]
MLTPVLSHRWDVSPGEAAQIQRDLAARLLHSDTLDEVRLVAGVDVGLWQGRARAAVTVHALPALDQVEAVVCEGEVTFPYVPGLLSFREGPVVLAALAQLHTIPDVLIFDGQGYAHPRRMGLASHIGVLLDWPSIGCAKSRLVGQHDEPADARGSAAALWDGEEQIGLVLRTRQAVRPVYVSVGHRVGLGHAAEIVLACGAGYRLPEPTRWAHRLASQR